MEHPLTKEYFIRKKAYKIWEENDQGQEKNWLSAEIEYTNICNELGDILIGKKMCKYFAYMLLLHENGAVNEEIFGERIKSKFKKCGKFDSWNKWLHTYDELGHTNPAFYFSIGKGTSAKRQVELRDCLETNIAMYIDGDKKKVSLTPIFRDIMDYVMLKNPNITVESIVNEQIRSY